MTNYLTQDDVDRFGGDLVNLAQRAAAHALEPTLQGLANENAELQRRLAKESRHRLDQQVAAAVPNYREIDRDPRWHQWLIGLDPHTGQLRQTILNDAIASGNVSRVAAFFRGFEREIGHATSA